MVVNTKVVIFILLFNHSQFILCIDKHVGYSCRKSKVASDEICKSVSLELLEHVHPATSVG